MDQHVHTTNCGDKCWPVYDRLWHVFEKYDMTKFLTNEGDRVENFYDFLNNDFVKKLADMIEDDVE